MSNAFFYLPKGHVEKYVDIDKRKKYEDLVHCLVKHNVNRYETITSFISNFLTEVTGTDEMYKMLNEFNNEINKLKSDNLAGQVEEIDVTENVSIVYNNQLKFFDDYILKDKQKTPTKRKCKPGSPSSPLSIRFPSQENIAKRVKLKPPEREKKKQDHDLTPNKLLARTSNIISTNKG